MPELPEVETIRQQLQKTVAGKKIKTAEILLSKIVKAPLTDFKKAVIGAAVKKVSRRAKILIFELNNGWSLLIHLKLTGQLIYQSLVISNKLSVENKHTHVIFHFTDGSRLLFNDLRQFGYIKLVQSDKLKDFFIKEGVGPEPLEKDFTLADFKMLLSKKSNAKIKQFLMDQKNLAGIGNIYSDEILFFGRVHPLRQVSALRPEEVKKIYTGIKKILSAAIKLKGTSANNYLDAYGRRGRFLEKLKVYGKERQKCVKCKKEIVRVKIGGRSAHFCPACQRLEP